jgi:hypothetical protein
MGVGVSFLLILLSGFWLGRSGKSYSATILAVHKLLSLAAVILLGISVHRTNQTGALGGIQVLAVVLSGAFFLGTIATGGALSTGKAMPAIILRLHRITPYLTVLATVATLYFLPGSGVIAAHP